MLGLILDKHSKLATCIGTSAIHARLELSLFGLQETTLPHDLASKKAVGGEECHKL